MVRLLDKFVVLIDFRTNADEVLAAQRRVDALKKNLSSTAMKVGLAGAAITATGYGITSTALGFERVMNRLRSVYLDATAEQMLALRELAKEMGATTSKRASEAAEAQVELARAGLTVAENIAALPAVLNLAIAGELDMATAAKMVVTQLRAYNKDAKEATRITDILVGTANNYVVTVELLRPALRQAIGAGAGLNIPVEQLAAGIGTIMTATGARADQAGTAVRNFMSFLLDPMPQAIETLREMGIEYQDVLDLFQQGDLLGVVRLLSQGGMTVGQSIQLFGKEMYSQIKGWVDNLQAYEDGVDLLVNRVDGIAVEAREAIESGTPGAWDEFWSAMQNMNIQLGESGLMEGLRKFLNLGKEVLNLFSNDAPPAIRKIAVWLIFLGPLLIGLGAALQFVAFALGGYSLALRIARWAIIRKAAAETSAYAAGQTYGGLIHQNTIRTRIATLAERIRTVSLWATVKATLASGVATARETAAKVANTASSWAAAAGQWALNTAKSAGVVVTYAAAAAQWVLNVAMYAFPLVWIVGAIAAVIAAMVAVVYAIYTFRDAILGGLQRVWNWIKNNWWAIAPFLTGPLYLLLKFKDDIWSAFNWLFSGIQGIALSAANVLISIFHAVKRVFDQTIGWAIDKIMGAPGWIWDKLKGAAGAIGGFLGFGEDDAPGPRAAPAGTAASIDNRTVSTSFNIERIDVNAPGGDPGRIASEIDGRLRSEIVNAGYAVDNGVAQ